MAHITANELKTRGVSAVEELLADEDEVVVSVRGRDAYVMMKIETYAQLRDFDLERALREARADYAAGRYVTESVEEHLRRVGAEPGDS